MDLQEFERIEEGFRQFHAKFAPAFGRKQWRERSQDYLRGLLVQAAERGNAHDELLAWLRETQRRNERAKRSYARRRWLWTLVQLLAGALRHAPRSRRCNTSRVLH